MEDYSLSALAKVLGRAKSGLHKLAKSGQIPMLSNGRYNLASVQAALASNVDPGRQRGVHRKSKARGERAAGEQSGDQVNTASVRPVSTPDEAREAISMVRRILDEEGVKAGMVDFNATRTADLILKARERAIRIEVAQGRLVDADAVRKTVFNLSREDRDSWTNWPARIAPIMAAQFGLDQMALTIYLEEAVRQHLTERADPALRFKVGA